MYTKDLTRYLLSIWISGIHPIFKIKYFLYKHLFKLKYNLTNDMYKRLKA